MIRDYDGRTRGSEVKIRSNGSDPTLTTVSNEAREQIRSTVRRAGRVIDRTASDLAEVHSSLQTAMSRLDPPQVPLPGILPRPATRAEVALSREAAQRRMARGENYGQG